MRRWGRSGFVVTVAMLAGVAGVAPAVQAGKGDGTSVTTPGGVEVEGSTGGGGGGGKAPGRDSTVPEQQSVVKAPRTEADNTVLELLAAALADRPSLEFLEQVQKLLDQSRAELDADLHADLHAELNAGLVAKALPKDMWFHILTNLSEQELGRLSEVGKWSRQLVSEYRLSAQYALRPDAKGVVHVWNQKQLDMVLAADVPPRNVGLHFTPTRENQDALLAACWPVNPDVYRDNTIQLFHGATLTDVLVRGSVVVWSGAKIIGITTPDIVNRAQFIDVHKGGHVEDLKGGMVKVRAGGTAANVTDAQVEVFDGGTVSKVSGKGFVHVEAGGTVSDVSGGYVVADGGTITNVTGGKIDFSGKNPTTIFLGSEAVVGPRTTGEVEGRTTGQVEGRDFSIRFSIRASNDYAVVQRGYTQLVTVIDANGRVYSLKPQAPIASKR